MRIYAEDNTNYIKSLDTGTEVKLQIIDYDGTPMNLNQFKKVLLKIGKEDLGTILTIEPMILPNGFVKFTIPENTLVKGNYNIEAHMYESMDIVRIAPSNGKFLAIVTKSLDELGKEIAYISVQQLIDNIESIKKLVEENVGDSLLPISTANNAVDIATKAELESDEAKDIANQAKANVDTANATSEQAKTIATEAKNIANQTTDNSNEAIKLATEAKAKAETGIAIANNSSIKSDSAVTTANNAKQTAELVRQEFDQLTAGNTDAEIIASRTNASNITFDNLKARLDDMDSNIDTIDGKKIENSSIPLAKLENKVATLDTNGNVLDGNGQIVEGKVKSVNGLTGDVVLDVSSVGIVQQDTRPEGIEEGRLWLDTSENVENGGLFNGIKNQVIDAINDTVDEKDATILINSKDYTNAKNAESLEYTDTKSAEVLQIAKDYTNTKNVESLEYTDTKSAEVLQIAKDYTDNNVPQIPEIDTSNLATKQSVEDLSSKLHNHVSDSEIHVTFAERELWNKGSQNIVTTTENGLMSYPDKIKLDSLINLVNTTTFNNHVNDTTVHITSTERASWNNKAPTSSPSFTGTPTAPTPATTTNNTQIATTSFVQSVVDSSKNKTAILVYPSVANGYQNGAYSHFDRFTVINDSLGEVNGHLITPKNSGWYQFFGQFGFWLNKIQTFGRFDLGIEENPIISTNLGKTVTNSNDSSTYSQDKNIYTSTQYITHSNFHKLAYLRAGQDYRISIFCALDGISGAIDIGLGSTYFAITRI